MASPMSSADLLLHPVRLRIVQSFLGGRELTVAQLQPEHDGVSPATIYRQVAILARAEILEVTNERKVRGASERTYRLRVEHASVDPADLRLMSVAQHRSAFMTFLAAVMVDFDEYVAAEGFDFERDLAGYRQTAFSATDDEMTQIAATIRAAIADGSSEAASADLPDGAPAARRRILTTIVVPKAVAGP